MNFLISAALIGLALYWGWLAAPKVKAFYHKLKNNHANASQKSDSNNNN